MKHNGFRCVSGGLRAPTGLLTSGSVHNLVRFTASAQRMQRGFPRGFRQVNTGVSGGFPRVSGGFCVVKGNSGGQTRGGSKAGTTRNAGGATHYYNSKRAGAMVRRVLHGVACAARPWPLAVYTGHPPPVLEFYQACGLPNELYIESGTGMQRAQTWGCDWRGSLSEQRG